MKNGIAVWPSLGMAPLLALLLLSSVAYGQGAPEALRQVRSIPAAELGLRHPAGIAFSQEEGLFYVRGAGASRSAAHLEEDPPAVLPFSRSGPVGVEAGLAADVALDPETGSLYILDRRWQEIVSRDAGSGAAERALLALPLPGVAASDVVALAFNSEDGHVYLLLAGGERLLAVDPASGERFEWAVPRGLREPTGAVFAPSGDSTDAPEAQSLYVADASGGEDGAGRIVELSLAVSAATPAAASGDVVATLVQTIHTSQFNPPSPDPAGIAYLPSVGNLLVSDSEVNEVSSLYLGFNLFETSRSGNLVALFTTDPDFSDEPTGAAVNPANLHCFFSDDTGTRSIYVVDPRNDGDCGTPDDSVTSFPTGAFGSSDPEGVAFGQGTLFLVDGSDNEVYKITPGNNGVFDGVGVDDQVTSFDTASLGVTDPEGIEYDPSTGHLYVVGKPDTVVIEVTTGGSLVRNIDISEADARKPAGIALAPGSQSPSEMNLYIVDRGVDNDSDPRENDGKIYELSFGQTGGGEQFTLTVNVQPNGSGSVSPSGGSYPDGSQLTLTATPSAGFVFSGWSGDLGGNSNPASLTMSGDRSVVAHFSPAPPVSLDVSVVGQGSVSLAPSGGSYPVNTQVTLTANPATGYRFAGWSGDLSGSSNPASLTMDSDKNVTATFVRAFTLDLDVVGKGNVSLSPSGGVYDAGTVVALRAKPGKRFIGWSGDLGGSDSTETLTMNSNKSVTATFRNKGR